ncbi:TPA: hypothetical protein ACH3X3_002028 [Trebouxia sp. C0006]
MEAYDSPLERDLQQACHCGDLPGAKRLMSQGANVFARNKKGFTFLMITASRGHLSVAKELLTAAAGADVNAVNNQQHTALILACDQGHLDILRLLLNYGAEFNKEDHERRWPLLFAANEGHIEIVYELLACGVDCNQFYYYGTALTMACQSGHLDVVKALLAHGAHVNWGDDEASTPLHYACSNEQLPVVRCLLRHGANPFLKEDNGDSPRTLAILILSSDGPSKKRSDILSCLQKRQKPQGQRDRLQQLKAAHLVKIRALRLQHVARLHTVLCCLQLAAPKKPYLPRCLVRRIAIMAYNKEEHAYKYAPHNPQREQCFTFVKAAGQS